MNLFAKLFRVREWRHLRELGKTWKLGMTSRQEQQWLRTYAARNYCGHGAIVGLGFVGATTIALAEGLTLTRTTAKQKQIHVYDLFICNEGYEKWAKGIESKGVLS
jgi:hypothetical protein